MKKGFIHILEIIIVMVGVFVLIMQLVGTPRVDTDWTNVLFSLRANDMLYTLDASGIDWFDGAAVGMAINSSLNASNLLYAVRLKNVIREGISVGVISNTDQEYSTLESSLRSPLFSINGQTPSFGVARITSGEMPFSYDVIFVINKDFGLSDAEKFLANGGGIVEIRDLSVALAGSNPGMGTIHNRLFGVAFSSEVHVGSGAVSFTDRAKDSSKKYFNIYNYFHHIPNGTGMKINETHYFQNFLEPTNEKMDAISPAEAVLSVDGSGAPALVLNEGMSSGRGRTAWLSAGLPLSSDDTSVLLKSLAVWASGEERQVVPGSGLGSSVTAYMYKVYNRDMMQPVEVALTIGSVY
jgi:hypothetical protein